VSSCHLKMDKYVFGSYIKEKIFKKWYGMQEYFKKELKFML